MNNVKTKELAERLGWVLSTQGNYCAIIDGIEIRAKSIIEFAAYAKAEMANRGWFVKVDERYGKFDHLLMMKGYDYTVYKPFDPTDPNSEANALILTCLDVLDGKVEKG